MKVQGLILGLLLPWFAQAQEQYYGTKVAGLTLSGTDSQADLEKLPLHPGDVLTSENLRAAIQALYETGHYRYVQADAVQNPDSSTSLTFQVRPNFFFSTFRIEPDNLLERPLSSYFRLPYGEKFSNSAVDRVVQDTISLLKSEGYFKASVEPLYDLQEATQLVFVTLKASPGEKARIGTVQITGGEETFSRKELQDALDLASGEDFSAAKLDKGVADIRAKFTDLRGFLNTRVASEFKYNDASNTVDLDVTVQPGQFVHVEPRGFDIKAKKMRDLVPVFEEGAVDQDLIEEGRVRITRYMQEEGYFDASVQSELIEIPPELGNALQINYKIASGAKHDIVDVKITGNHHFSDDEIRRRMKSRRNELLNRGVFSAEILEEDRRTIEAMYRNAGFQDTVVTATPDDVDHGITVLVQITEGKQLPIDFITILGNFDLSEKELRDELKLKEHDTYTPGAVDQARAALTQLYYLKGYADARVERTVERVESNNGVRITFQITEGRRYNIGSILVEGNTLTADKVVRRTSRLQEYKPYNPEDILEAQQRLYATGLFTRVEIVTLDQGATGLRNVLIQVEDAKPILLTYGVGYQEFEHLRGTFEVSHNNLFGLSRSLSFRSRGSSRERLGQLTYKEPRLFNHEIDGFASAFIEHTERPFFSANRVDFSLQTLKRFSVQDNFLITSSYQKVNIGDIRINPHAQKDDSQQGPCKICQIARVGTSYVTDRRDDPLNPRTGTFNTVTFQVASSILGSKLNFTSLFNRSNFYFPVRSGVLATSFRFGWNHPFGKTAEFATVVVSPDKPAVLQTQQLPATERYFAGGSTTLRGLSLDEASPRSHPTQEGGNVMTIGNVEYRVPLKTPIKGLEGALFYDTGNVFPSMPSVSIREFTHTAGFGLRYQTPVGPVRLDFGINLRPGIRPDATREDRFKVFFTLGNPF